MEAKMRVLGLILSSYPYLRSAMVRFPLIPKLSKWAAPPCCSKLGVEGNVFFGVLV